MGSYRVLYYFALLCSFAFFVVYPLWFSGYLLVCILLLIPFDLLISLPGMFTKRLEMSAPKMMRQGEAGALYLRMVQKSRFAAGRVKIRVTERHDDGRVKHRIKCNSQRGNRFEMALDTSRSGFTVFSYNRYWATSLLGLFSVPVRESGRVGVLVLPAPVKPIGSVSLPKLTALRPAACGVFSEEHDLRPFRAGDPLKSVHWKLSAKHDALLVREPLLPMPHSRLIQFEHWNNARERDLILGRLLWITKSLLKRGICFYVRFQKHGQITEVTELADLVNYLYAVLDEQGEAPANNPAVPKRFTWVFVVEAG